MLVHSYRVEELMSKVIYGAIGEDIIKLYNQIYSEEVISQKKR